MQAIKLSDVVDIVALTSAIQHRIATTPTLNNLMAVQITASTIVRDMAIEAIANLIKAPIQAAFDAHIVKYGDYNKDAIPTVKMDWSEPMEQAFLDIVDQYQASLSAHWLGTADSRAPRTPDGIDKACQNFAEEVYRNTTYIHDNENPREKSAAQVLSSVGIVGADLETLIGATPRAPIQVQPKEIDMAKFDMKTVIGTLNEFTEMCGFTGKTLYDILDNATDSDPGLSASGASQIGVADLELVAYLRELRARYGLEHLTVMVETNTPAPRQDAPPAEVVEEFVDLSEFSTPAVEAPVQQTPAVAEGPQEGATAKTADGRAIVFTKGAWAFSEDVKPKAPLHEDAEGVVPAEALKLIKDFTSMKNDDLSAGLGVTRQTFDNYTKGKGPKLPASTQNKAFLLSVITEHLGALSKAHSIIEAL